MPIVSAARARCGWMVELRWHSKAPHRFIYLPGFFPRRRCGSFASSTYGPLPASSSATVGGVGPAPDSFVTAPAAISLRPPPVSFIPCPLLQQASCAVVVFDVTNRESFLGSQNWVTELQRRGEPNVVIALAGNKADVRTGRTVTYEVRPWKRVPRSAATVALQCSPANAFAAPTGCAWCRAGGGRAQQVICAPP